MKDIDPEERMNMVKAIVTEISNLCKLGVFSLEVMEDSSNPISTKFVLKVKRKADGSYDKHKARLVVRGFLAKMGVDFYATFSPMSSLITARTLMVPAGGPWGWRPLWQRPFSTYKAPKFYLSFTILVSLILVNTRIE